MNEFINIMEVPFCNSDTAYRLLSFLGKIFEISKIIVPIIIILFGIFDLVKSMVNQNDNSHIKLFVKRVIYGVVFFFLVSIISFVFSLINQKWNNKCMEIFLNPDDTTITKIDISEVTNEDECKNLGKPYIWEDNTCKIDISNEKIGD